MADQPLQLSQEASARIAAAQQMSTEAFRALRDTTAHPGEIEEEYNARKAKESRAATLADSNSSAVQMEVMQPIWKDQSTRGFPRFVKTVLGQSDLVPQVKAYTLRAQGRKPYDDNDGIILDMSVFTDDEWKHIEAAVKAVSSDDKETQEWLADIKKGYWDALAGAILPLLTELEVLSVPDMQPWHFGGLTWLKKSLTRIASSQRQALADSSAEHGLLPKLKKVEMAWHDTEDGFGIADMLPFVSIPTVTQFFGFACGDEDWSPRNETTQTQLHLEEIRLSYSMLDEKSMQNLFALCPKLKVFTFETGGSGVGYSELVPCNLGPALEILHPCLEELELADEDSNHFGEEDWESPLPASALKGFQKLHTLRVPARMLVGATDENGVADCDLDDISATSEDEFGVVSQRQYLTDALPKSLKFLDVSLCQEDFLAQLEDLCEKSRLVTPELKTIRLDGYAGGDYKKHNGLVDAFKKKGIDLIVF